jgi:hypothetical protein
MSRDPFDGYVEIPETLQKYLYVGSNPVNYVDPRGRELLSYAIKSNAAIPEGKLIVCVRPNAWMMSLRPRKQE